MKCNVGGIDRVLRILIGAVVLGAGVYLNSWWGAIGAIPLFTGLVGWCPAYMPLNISSCKINEEE
jgi:hypothetical protein